MNRTRVTVVVLAVSSSLILPAVGEQQVTRVSLDITIQGPHSGIFTFKVFSNDEKFLQDTSQQAKQYVDEKQAKGKRISSYTGLEGTERFIALTEYFSRPEDLTTDSTPSPLSITALPDKKYRMELVTGTVSDYPVLELSVHTPGRITQASSAFRIRGNIARWSGATPPEDSFYVVYEINPTTDVLTVLWVLAIALLGLGVAAFFVISMNRMMTRRSAVAVSQRFCTHCGHVLKTDATFCSQCGARR